LRLLELLIGHYLCIFATDYPVLITAIRVLFGVAAFAKNVLAALAAPPVAVECFPRNEINKIAYAY